MSDEQIHEQIEDFLRGLLPEEEEAAFRARMEADPVLKEAVNRRQAALLALQFSSEEAMRDRIARWEQKSPVEHSPSKQNPASREPLRILPWLKWGAMVTVIALLVYFLTKPQGKPEAVPEQPVLISPSKDGAAQNEAGAKEALPITQPEPPRLTALAIVRDASKPFRAGTNLRNNSQEAKQDTIAMAIDLLQKKRVKEALNVLNACRSCKALDKAQWRGHAYFQLGNFERAIQEFTFVLENGYNKGEPQWYLFLACYANDKKPEDIYLNNLNALKNPAHPYHPEFLEVEKKLKKAGYSMD